MTGNLLNLKKDLKSFAKRCKDFRYTNAALITFLITGVVSIRDNLFSAEMSKSIESQKQVISTSIKDMHTKVQQTRRENDKLLKKTNLELIQLMEQGDHVVKSPWSSWQYGINGFYSNWNGRYKGRGDKEEKYPYQGIFERSNDLYERSISPDSGQYNLLHRNRKPNFASGSSKEFGVASFKTVKEPIIPFEVNAGIRPRNINKSAITIAAKTAITPELPEAIKFTPPKPVISIPALPELPSPPTFNIQLGSFCNFMTPDNSCNNYVENGGKNPINDNERSFLHRGNINLSDGDIQGKQVIDGHPAVRYSWNGNSTSPSSAPQPQFSGDYSIQAPQEETDWRKVPLYKAIGGLFDGNNVSSGDWTVADGY